MAARRWILSVLLALLLWPAGVRGESPELMEAYGRYQEFDAVGRYNEAIPFAEEALRLGEHEFGPDDPTTAVLVNNLALLYRDQGRCAEAEPLYQRALAINEATLGPDHPEVATNLNNLALLYHDQARYAEAEPLYQRALDIKEKALGSEHPDVATSVDQPGRRLYDRSTKGRYAEAESLYRRSLSIREKALGPEHSDVSITTRADTPRPSRSINARWPRARIEQPGERFSHVQGKLAGLYDDQGRYAEAESLYRRSLSIREKALGPEHSDVAQSPNNLAKLYHVQGKFREAEPNYQRALVIWEKGAEASSCGHEPQQPGGTLRQPGPSRRSPRADPPRERYSPRPRGALRRRAHRRGLERAKVGSLCLRKARIDRHGPCRRQAG